MKRFLLCAVLAAGMQQANAQQLQLTKQPTPTTFDTGSLLAKAPAREAADENTIYWGYPTAPVNTFGMGWQPEVIAQGIAVPANLLKGCKLKGVTLMISNVPHVKDVNVWVSAALPADYTTGDIMNFAPDLAGITSGQMTDILFDTPYTIGDNNFYVGYTFTQTEMTENSDYYPLTIYDGSREMDGGYWLYTSGTFPFWFNMYGFGYGNLAFDLILDISECEAQGSVKVGDIGIQTAKAGGELSMDIPLTNGAGFVKDIDFTYTEGDNSATYHWVLDKPLTRLNEVKPFTLQMEAPSEPSATPVALSVDQVNGKANAEDVLNESEGMVITISKEGSRRTVYEAFTTIDDPREVLAMAAYPLLKEAAGDKMIAINAHFSTKDDQPDPMACEDYDDTGFTITNGILPVYIFDRKLQTNPYYGRTGAGSDGKYHFRTNEVFNEVNSRISESDFGLSVRWADEDMTKIEATTTSTFYFNSEEPFYAIGFVLTEDNVSYEGTTQDNALSPDYEEWPGYKPENNTLFPDDDLKEYTTGPATIENPVNQNIVRGAWGALNGIDGSIDAIENAVEQNYTTTLDISAKEVLDKKNLKLVALLINLMDGSIANAAEVMLDETAVGITTQGSDVNSVAARYNIGGQMLNTPKKGLNIVKLSNGKTMKVNIR